MSKTKKQTRSKKDFALMRMERAWELRSEGYSQQTIAKMMGIAQCTVGYHLRKYTTICEEFLKDKIEIDIEEQIAFLNKIVEEAMIAWNKSKTEIKVDGKNKPSLIIRKGNGTGTKSEQISEYRENYGDVKYLNIALNAKDRIRKILGTDAPLKIQHEIPEGAQISSVEQAFELLSKHYDERSRSADNSKCSDN